MPARAAEIAIASAAGLAVGYLCTAAPSQIPAGQGRYDVRCKLDIKAINAQIVANETQYAANVGKPSALPCAATQDFTYTCTPFTEGTALTEWQKVVHFLGTPRATTIKPSRQRASRHTKTGHGAIQV